MRRLTALLLILMLALAPILSCAERSIVVVRTATPAPTAASTPAPTIVPPITSMVKATATPTATPAPTPTTTAAPTITSAPTAIPTPTATAAPTTRPVIVPVVIRTATPAPSAVPTAEPSVDIEIVPTAVPTPVPTPTFEERMAEYVYDRFRGRKIVGGAVVIAKDGEVLFSYAYGRKTNSGRDAFTLNSCLRIASVTKLVSAVGLLQLLEQKGIPLDTPVKDIVGYAVINPAFPNVPITIRQVMSHTSSLVQTQHYHPNWEFLRHDNKYFSAAHTPGEKYEYSNLNGGLIGAMIEALSGQSVNTYMQEHVFLPLGINAAYHPALLLDQRDIAPQLTKDARIAVGVSNALSTINNYNNTCDPRANTEHTSGSLYISANGMIRIISMLQRGGELDGVRILSEDTVRMMMQDQNRIPGSSVTGSSEYGLCTARVYGMPGGTWYGHQGLMKGLSSNIYFQPDTGLSIAVIANGYNPQTRDGVATIARVMMEKAQEFLYQTTE